MGAELIAAPTFSPHLPFMHVSLDDCPSQDRTWDISNKFKYSNTSNQWTDPKSNSKSIVYLPIIITSPQLLNRFKTKH